MRYMQLVLILSVFIVACDSSSNNESTNSKMPDTSERVNTMKDTVNETPYNAATDGMLVAPGMTRKLGDSLGMKMYEVTMKPGDSIPLHVHPDHTFYVVSGGKAAIYFKGTDRQEWELKPGMGFINGHVADAAKNIGKTTLKFLVVDVYRPLK